MNKEPPDEEQPSKNVFVTRASINSSSAYHFSNNQPANRPNRLRRGLHSLYDRKEPEKVHSQDLSSSGTEGQQVSSIGIRGIIRRASVSFKNRRRQIQDIDQRPKTTWEKLRTATGFHWQQRSLSTTSQLGIDIDNREYSSSVTGYKSQAPKIPLRLGGSAKRTTLESNRTLPYASIKNSHLGRCPQLFSVTDHNEDGESGIGIAITSSTNPIENLDPPIVENYDNISRVDFISDLPAELAIQILAYLDQKTLCNLSVVSRKWLDVSQAKCIWREVFLRDQTTTYATGKPIILGAGLGLPASKPDNNWKDLYRVREQLRHNWMRGAAQAVYLNGHLDSIYCVQFDENKIITGSRDKTIRVWDLKKYICILIIGPPDIISHYSIMRDNEGQPQHFATMSDMTKKPSEAYPATVSFPIYHNQSILCLQFDKDILATGSSDSTCILYDIKKGYKPIRQFRHHTAAVLDLVFDTRHIVTCSKDYTICIIDRENGTLLKQLRGHLGPVNAVQLRGNIIVSCSGDCKVKLWNIDTGKNIKELTGHTNGLACGQFSDNSRYIASAGNDKIIRIWDANTGEILKSIVAHENLVRSLHIDSISGRLVSGSYDQDIKVFDMATGALLLDFPKWHTCSVLGAKSDYRRIISTGQDTKILIMDFGMSIKGIEKLES
ncbi:BgTH12-06475 [Blumeria graminis f. sp. triticale]|uniref:Bgt-1807 n=3 Tax=Blumeria graminis TaxID=34373 RepID=A0A061HDG5_BLUGR|nr:F-box protein [Blumeria graminis f. sp. tritici 96224]CAD6500768.1 BgTH12-06475 [Blumeria graminis f. sp. triticale]VCU41046.1 Bgt-1807 [Blumeria graminis f. sp. tritici]